MKMKHLAAAAAAMGIVSAVAEELSIDRAFSVNGRMHVFVSAADWTNDVNDYALKSRAHGAEAWSDMGLGASNWWGPGGQPWGGQVCLTSAMNSSAISRFTSASISASRISDIVSAMFASVNTAWPRSFFSASCSFPVRLLNEK